MAEAAFFYNTTTQRGPTGSRRPSLSRPGAAAAAAAAAATKYPVPQIKKQHLKQKGKSRASSTSSSSSHSKDSRAGSLHSVNGLSLDTSGSGGSGSGTLTERLITVASPTGRTFESTHHPSRDLKLNTGLPAIVPTTSHGSSITDRKYAVSSTPETPHFHHHRSPIHRYDMNSYRTASMSSTSGTASTSALTSAASSDPPSNETQFSHPFTRKYGRRVLRDSTLPYPLPCDVGELNRQILRSILMCQVFGGPICNPVFRNKAPKRVLEIGCGTGIWSSLCHQHYAKQGQKVAFTGLDIAPLAPDMGRDDDMIWKFVQHDLRRFPFPFSNDEFDFIMIKDCSLIVGTNGIWQQALMDEYLRILQPGGILEFWDGDQPIRILLPHPPPLTTAEGGSVSEEEAERAQSTGTYNCTLQTPLTNAHNEYLATYNNWITKALQQRQLTPTPCTVFLGLLHQEPNLADVDSRRVAIPLGDEVRWEKEGIGGVKTDTNTVLAKGKEPPRKSLTAGQSALRRTALLTVVQMMESLEPVLRDASGMGPDEWDRWQSNMMNSVIKQQETTFGECLEIGAFWARKTE